MPVGNLVQRGSGVRERAALGVLLVAVLLTGGCSRTGSSDPPVDHFAAGTCRQAAPPTIAVGKLVADVTQHAKTAQQVEPAITQEQARLRALLPSAGPTARPLQDLITAIGYFRITLDSHTYTTARLADVKNARAALIRYCTK